MSKVVFIGAGPGDPELITLKGKRFLEKADVVIYAGSLLNPEILKYAPEMAQNIKEEQFFLRLMDAATTASKQGVGKSEMLTLLMSLQAGGVGGLIMGNPLIGLLSGLGTAGLLNIPQRPLLATGVAQGLKKGTKVAGGATMQGTRTLLQMLAPYLTNSIMNKE